MAIKLGLNQPQLNLTPKQPTVKVAQDEGPKINTSEKNDTAIKTTVRQIGVEDTGMVLANNGIVINNERTLKSEWGNPYNLPTGGNGGNTKEQWDDIYNQAKEALDKEEEYRFTWNRVEYRVRTLYSGGGVGGGRSITPYIEGSDGSEGLWGDFANNMNEDLTNSTDRDELGK